MKFEDFLKQSRERQTRRIVLEKEVEVLQQKLDGELKLNNVLRYALKGPILSCPPLPKLLPFKVRTLLDELEIMEREITWLEAKLRMVKRSLHIEKKLKKEEESSMQPKRQVQIKLLPYKNNNQVHHHKQESLLLGNKLSMTSILDLQKIRKNYALEYMDLFCRMQNVMITKTVQETDLR